MMYFFSLLDQANVALPNQINDMHDADSPHVEKPGESSLRMHRGWHNPILWCANINDETTANLYTAELGRGIIKKLVQEAKPRSQL